MGSLFTVKTRKGSPEGKYPSASVTVRSRNGDFPVSSRFSVVFLPEMIVSHAKSSDIRMKGRLKSKSKRMRRTEVVIFKDRMLWNGSGINI